MKTDPILFISDLHLSTQHPAYPLFLSFLKGPAKKARALYILGDLFDVWVGEDVQTVFQTKVQVALRRLADSGVALYFMSGNRDFLISRSFLKKARCQSLPDPIVVDLHGFPTLLTHGDLLCTADRTYQRYRKIVRCPLVRLLFLCLPMRTREKIGNALRKKSQQHQKNQEKSALDVTQEAVDQMLSAHKVRQLIHGHVHQPKIEHRSTTPTTKRIVLGDWHKQGTFIESTPNVIKLVRYKKNHQTETIASYALETLEEVFTG